jgi:hypothetical protein
LISSNNPIHNDDEEEDDDDDDDDFLVIVVVVVVLIEDEDEETTCRINEGLFLVMEKHVTPSLASSEKAAMVVEENLMVEKSNNHQRSIDYIMGWLRSRPCRCSTQLLEVVRSLVDGLDGDVRARV